MMMKSLCCKQKGHGNLESFCGDICGDTWFTNEPVGESDTFDEFESERVRVKIGGLV
jgi:hypothetical protein